ncbi:O-methyltransferase [Lentzea sp.]|uniref:O-methyltransferase n=1 Tax=Lentzea sp. TaxID=56099 RepID=UPI002BF8498C|nr:class I SAM-dependent methyltransferase [Lentzea sp.]HUQ54771.1 class I SAM-dependent methyltransferase [Lentzea sp.]
MAAQVDATPELLAYVREVSLRDDEILAGLRGETERMPAYHAMVTMPEEAQFLALLVRLIGASSVLEIGTFTGYSTLCMARALPAGGRIITCDVDRKWPTVAAGYWKRAGVADRIDFRLGDAAETMAGLLDDGLAGTVDLVFVDADKAGYERYYENALTLLRPGGLVVVDNTLYFGRVVDPDARDPDTEAIRRLNARLRDDDRVHLALLTMADGITLAHKKTA